MRIEISIFGITLIKLAVFFDEDAETEIVAGQGGSFERDLNPISPDDRYEWDYEEERFGFH